MDEFLNEYPKLQKYLMVKCSQPLRSNKRAKACLKSSLADFPAEVIIPYVKGYFKSTKTGNARISAFPVP